MIFNKDTKNIHLSFEAIQHWIPTLTVNTFRHACFILYRLYQGTSLFVLGTRLHNMSFIKMQ